MSSTTTENCPLCPSAVFRGANARGSLIRHLRFKAKNDEPHRALHQELTTTRNPTGESAIELRRKRDARYRTIRSSRATATKRFSKLKSIVKLELYKQHDDIKPQKLSRPQTPDLDIIITNDNRYRLLEEYVGIFAGRRRKLYEWASADKVILHYISLYFIISVRFGAGRGEDFAPRTAPRRAGPRTGNGAGHNPRGPA